MNIRKAWLPVIVSVVSALICAQAALAGFKPSDQYRAYLNHVYYAKSVHQIEGYFMESTRRSLENLKGELAEEALKRYKKSYVANFKVIKEEVVGDMAFIEASGLASDWGQVTKAKVRVEMLRENGAWKIKHQVWKGLVNPPRGKLNKLK